MKDMKTRFLASLPFLACALVPLRLSAETRTVTLWALGLSCIDCPAFVEQTLERVEGVLGVEVSCRTREVVIVFDDTRIGVEALIGSMAKVGYTVNVQVLEDLRPDPVLSPYQSTDIR